MDQVPKRVMPGTGDEVSALGFGCMRFKRNLGAIDMEKAEQIVSAALEAGVNYFDTAYMYPGSEKAIGQILAKTDALGKRRDRVFVATKLPLMAVKTSEDMDNYLKTSLDRLRMDYIDYYLVHNIASIKDWEKFKKLGGIEFLAEAKTSGKIKHIGFSWHGNLLDFKTVIDDYDWEFCQIQYNYLDENFQAGTEGLKYASSKGIGIIVMEPLRGGMIVGKMPVAARKLMREYKGPGAGRSAADWGLRWVWNHPEVACVLSGMNELSQIEENSRVAAESLAGSMTTEELTFVDSIRRVFHDAIQVNCTGCAYCMPCPFGVNIPSCFSNFNSQSMFGGLSPRISYNYALAPGKNRPSAKASACKKCGVCETKCPQHLPIMADLTRAAKIMEPPVFTEIITFGLRVMGR